MVVWEDVAMVSSRSMQEALRAVEAKDLALALFNADETTIEKIRSSISERQRASLEEEASLLSSPDADEVNQARESILEALRELIAAGSLRFDES